MLRYLTLLSLLIFLYSCGDADSSSGLDQATEVVAEGLPVVTNFPAENLGNLKNGVESKRPEYTTAVNDLVEQADEELTASSYTIVNKKILPPSGNPNDYLSIAPYWWPDPEKADGLPWIRRDGEVNPITQGDNVDKTQRGDFFEAMRVLTYANYLTGEEKYGIRADTLLRTWFLDPTTRMNPNLDYAQGIPGVNTGRCYGVIELRGLIDIVTYLQILDHQGDLSEATKAGVDEWLIDYLNWLQTSALGTEEGSRTNNHGTWYDTQVMAYLIYLGRTEKARALAESVKLRVNHQIDEQGKQPEELVRTNTLHYSNFNLEAFVKLAYYGKLLGVDLWDYTSPEGGSIHGAFEFLKPYAMGDEEWTLPQIDDISETLDETRGLFQEAGNYFGLPEYCALGGSDLEEMNRLLYRCE